MPKLSKSTASVSAPVSDVSVSTPVVVKKTKVAKSVAPTTVVEEPVVSSSVSKKADKPAKEPKEPKAKKEKAVVAPAPVDAPIVSDASADASSAEVPVLSETSELVIQSSELLTKLTQMSAIIASLKNEYRSLEKKWLKEIKVAQKSQAKRKRKSGNRQPSGFVKPTKISDELAQFLEKPIGSEMARTEVTREINKYIQAHQLQDKSNGRKIVPDAKLQALLKVEALQELTYFNLQRYMSPHFFSASKAVAV
jgi:chromatin remodeling complex protein RSC6